ncbi:MAG: sulfocyanin-like copper-binding protein, partial [Gaiellaceae bacterium]
SVTIAAAATAAFLAAAAGAATPPASYLSWSSSRHVVHLRLLAGLGGANDGFNFNGYGRGRLLVRVPLGWRVVVECTNRGARRSSCAVVKGSLSTRPAFAGASSPDPITGIGPGASATFSFVAARLGTFRIASLVAGQEQARMFAVLDVIPDGRPSIAARPGP